MLELLVRLTAPSDRVITALAAFVVGYTVLGALFALGRGRPGKPNAGGLAS